jgi:ribosomal protein S18 acetylase RimI-like enzyme
MSQSMETYAHPRNSGADELSLNGDPCVIRPARKTDLEAILSIEQQFGADAYDREYMLRCLRRCKIFWTLEQQQSIQGYLMAQYRKNGKSVHLYSIAIDQNLHRTGLGRTLLQRLEDYCADRKLTRVTLECREDSIQAQEFYLFERKAVDF